MDLFVHFIVLGVPVDFEEVDLTRSNYCEETCNAAVSSISRNKVALKGSSENNIS